MNMPRKARVEIKTFDLKDHSSEELLKIVNTPIVHWFRDFGIKGNYGAYRVENNGQAMSTVRTGNLITGFKPLQ